MWEELAIDHFGDIFIDFYDKQKLTAVLINQLIILCNTTFETYLQNKVNQISKLFKEENKGLRKKIKQLLSENYSTILDNEEYVNKTIAEEYLKIVEQLFSDHKLFETLQDNVKSKAFGKLLYSLFKIFFFVEFHDPPLTLKLPKTSFSLNLCTFNNGECLWVEGMPRDIKQGIVLIDPPMLRQTFAYQGLKPIAIIYEGSRDDLEASAPDCNNIALKPNSSIKNENFKQLSISDTYDVPSEYTSKTEVKEELFTNVPTNRNMSINEKSIIINKVSLRTDAFNITDKTLSRTKNNQNTMLNQYNRSSVDKRNSREVTTPKLSSINFEDDVKTFKNHSNFRATSHHNINILMDEKKKEENYELDRNDKFNIPFNTETLDRIIHSSRTKQNVSNNSDHIKKTDNEWIMFEDNKVHTSNSNSIMTVGEKDSKKEKLYSKTLKNSSNIDKLSFTASKNFDKTLNRKTIEVNKNFTKFKSITTPKQNKTAKDVSSPRFVIKQQLKFSNNLFFNNDSLTQNYKGNFIDLKSSEKLKESNERKKFIKDRKNSNDQYNSLALDEKHGSRMSSIRPDRNQQSYKELTKKRSVSKNLIKRVKNEIQNKPENNKILISQNSQSSLHAALTRSNIIDKKIILKNTMVNKASPKKIDRYKHT